eukprot:GEMP01045066.1.p1 GENE.GEMP01045066.1~~GEMP01045066.1.p1  ORF type:complete len:358 (+),score=30.11 GEMP01045066.1:39-1112(+)
MEVLDLSPEQQCLERATLVPGTKWSPRVLDHDWWAFTLLLAFLLLCARHVLNVLVFRPVAMAYVGGGSLHVSLSTKSEEDSKTKTKKNSRRVEFDRDSNTTHQVHEVLVSKFIKYEWNALFYAITWPFVLSLLRSAPWSIFSNANWELGLAASPSPEDPGEFYLFPNDSKKHCVLQKKITFLFAVEFAWYVHDFVETLLFDRNRSDFLMMMCHPMLAAVLIYKCVVQFGHRTGVYVLAVFDFADIVLYLAKMFHLSTSDSTGLALTARYQKGQTGALIAVASAWLISRMVIFTYLVRETYLYPIDNWGPHTMRSILTLLLMMQWVWGILCWRMVLSQVTRSTSDDTYHDSISKCKKQ